MSLSRKKYATCQVQENIALLWGTTNYGSGLETLKTHKK